MSKLKSFPLFFLYWLGFAAIKLPTAILGFLVVPFLYSYRHKEFDEVPKVFLPWQNPEDWKGGHRGTEHSLPNWWIKEPVDDIKIPLLKIVIRKAREARGFGFWSWYKYHAIRNPANGLRNFESLDLDIMPTLVEHYTDATSRKLEAGYRLRYEPTTMRKDGVKTAWYIAWQGYQAGVKVVHVWPDLKKDIKILKWTLLKAGPRHFVFKFGWRIEPKDRDIPIDPNGTRVDDAGFASKFLPYRKG